MLRGRGPRGTTWGLVLCAACAVFVGEPTARAKSSVQATGEVAAGWTDNVFNAPSAPLPPTACDANNQSCTPSLPACDPDKPPAGGCPAGSPLPKYKDFFFELRPGVVYVSSSARAVQRLSDNFAADLFVTHPQGNSYSDTLDWNGFFIPSKTTELMLGLQSQVGRINTLNLQNGADTTTLGVTPALATSTTFFSQGLNESLVYHIDQHWNFAQAVSFLAFIPLTPRTLPDTYTTTVDFGGERVFARDAVGLDLRSEYVVYGSVSSDGLTTPLQQQVINTAIARWRRDWSPFWNTEAALGVVEANNVGQTAETVWQPYALAVARYFNEKATGELRYEHNIIPNPLSGATFIADAVTLRAAVPLGKKTRLFLTGSGGYEHGQLINEDTAINPRTGVVATADIALADAALTWQALDWMAVFARYEYYHQFGHPSDGVFMQPNIERSIVLLGIGITYPTTAAAQVPNRPGLRVDRADMPMIPDPHSQPPVGR